MVAALYWFLATRGVLRWISLTIAILSPIVVLVLFIRANLLAEVVAAVVLRDPRRALRPRRPARTNLGHRRP